MFKDFMEANMRFSIALDKEYSGKLNISWISEIMIDMMVADFLKRMSNQFYKR